MPSRWWGAVLSMPGACVVGMLRPVTDRRVTIPSFVLDLGRSPGAVGALVAGSIAIFAAGLDPKVLSSGMPDSQAALRQKPDLESLFLLSVIVQAGFFLIGGAIGDLFGRRRVLLVALTGLAMAEALAIVFPSGPGFAAARVLAAAATGTVLPVALAVVAVTYTGAVRATALGVAYAALGAATAVAPALLLAVTPAVGRWPSFLLTAVFAVIAIWVVHRNVRLTGRSGLRVADVAGHSIWAFGLLAITGGVVGIGSHPDSVIRWVLIAGGLILLGVFLLWQRRRDQASEDTAIDVRPVTVALFAGVVIAVAQIAPSLEAPLFFRISQGSSALLATVAIAPFVLALLVSGPIAGLLLSRYSPRVLIAGGLGVIGAGDVLFGQAGTATPYTFFIVPLMAIGAGFVVGTCVRTAIIFASVPHRLPATAAALNQTSLVVGGQIGVSLVTTLVTTAAVASFTERAQSTPGVDVASEVSGFKSFLDAISTAQFGDVIAELPHATKVDFAVSYAAGVGSAMTTIGLIALAGAVVVWFAMGPKAPLTSVWEHRDERAAPPEAALADF